MKLDQNTVTQLFASTGVPGLDEILCGGLTQDRLFSIKGSPGSGKATLALQFLLEGARQGEPTLYISLAESEVEMRAVAASHHWSLDEQRQVSRLIGQLKAYSYRPDFLKLQWRLLPD
jgi:circadian clock protein KaiC